MRYIGQGYELIVAWPPTLRGPDAVDAVRTLFERQYEAAFGRTPRNGQIEIVNLRLSSLAGSLGQGGSFAAVRATTPPPLSRRTAYLGKDAGHIKCTVVDRASLPHGLVLRGATIIEEADSTLFVPPDWTATVLPGGAIHLRLSEEAAGADEGDIE